MELRLNGLTSTSQTSRIQTFSWRSTPSDRLSIPLHFIGLFRFETKSISSKSGFLKYRFYVNISRRFNPWFLHTYSFRCCATLFMKQIAVKRFYVWLSLISFNLAQLNRLSYHSGHLRKNMKKMWNWCPVTTVFFILSKRNELFFFCYLYSIGEPLLVPHATWLETFTRLLQRRYQVKFR